MEELIAQKDLLKEMSKRDVSGNKAPFSILFKSFSKTTWKASDEIYLPSAELCGNRSGKVNKDSIGIKPSSGKHSFTVYIPLIFMVNGKRVVA